MKQKIFIVSTLFIVLAVAFFTVNRMGPVNMNPGSFPTPSVIPDQTRPQVTVIIFDGINTATYSAAAANAFEALTTVATENNISVETKQYDFGVFVQSIAGKQSERDMAWIFSVNGKSADVAADKYELKNGDSVAWEYIKPSF